MNRDSEPESSPLIIKDLPMVACSPDAGTAAGVLAGLAARGVLGSKAAAGVATGRAGSGVWGVLPG